MSNRHISMMARIGYKLYCSHLVGNQCPANLDTFYRMQKQQIGDLVIELSTAGFWMRSEDPAPLSYLKVENAIGIVEKIEMEPYPREDVEGAGAEWNVKEDGPEPMEKAFYIRLLYDGTVFRWTNARFATILPVEGWPF